MTETFLGTLVSETGALLSLAVSIEPYFLKTFFRSSVLMSLGRFPTKMVLSACFIKFSLRCFFLVTRFSSSATSRSTSSSLSVTGTSSYNGSSSESLSGSEESFFISLLGRLFFLGSFFPFGGWGSKLDAFFFFLGDSPAISLLRLKII